MKTLFIADAHLKGKEDPYQQKLIRLLEKEGKEIGALFILGDLFEFWVSDHPILRREYCEVLNSLEKIKKMGVRIVYLEGNHDFLLGEFFKEELRAEIFQDYHVESINGLTFYFAHGDFANPRDIPYLFLRKMLRSFLFRFLLKVIPFGFIWKTGKFFASLGRDNWGRPDPKIKQELRNFAEKQFKKDIDIVILAHLHFPEFINVNKNGREHLYLNVGGWNPGLYYLIYDGKKFEHRQFSDE
jgi:UDP-2,3-diacylglucosamine hydrolase